jgi:MinD-like ATPase involved in chromosome partitioning or flagellar assembly
MFGGQTDRVPTEGVRSWLYGHGINPGPTVEEIIETERNACIEYREQLRRAVGPLCIGFFSPRGGDGKSVMSTMSLQMFYDINPSMERPILVDVNTSMTTLDALNGLTKEDFLTGKYWTMETLYDYIAQQVGDVDDVRAFDAFLARLEFDDINAKLAYRTDPQLPVIPLQLKATKFTLDDGGFAQSEVIFTGQQYLVVLRVLKKFFTLIIHDFGTETNSSLTRTAFRQQHILGVLTHSGAATTKMVGTTLEMLHMNYMGLLLNTVVIFNMTSPPSKQALRAVAKEKAGKKPRYRKLAAATRDQEPKEAQTPGQALELINGITQIDRLVAPLELDEIALVGFDPHLKLESKQRFDEVSAAVEAQLWTAMRLMLRTRADYEDQFLKKVPEGTIVRRGEMMVGLSERKEIHYKLAATA